MGAISSGGSSIVSPSGRSSSVRPLWRAIAICFAVCALLVPAAVTQAAKPEGKPPGSVDVQLLAINDFHGNLQPPSGSSGRVGSTGSTTTDLTCAAGAPDCYLAGGVEYLATDIKTAKATNPNTLVLSAGDNIGASPLLSAAFHDEPTIEAMNALGLDYSAVGNHEFDEGVTELLRMQNGGCHPTDGCQDGDGFAGANFQFLAANVVYKNNGKTIFPAYKMANLGGAKIGIIGLTLKGTPDIVSANGIQNVNFLDEATPSTRRGGSEVEGRAHDRGAAPRGRSSVKRRSCQRSERQRMCRLLRRSQGHRREPG